jgi:hypothetical protein
MMPPVRSNIATGGPDQGRKFKTELAADYTDDADWLVNDPPGMFPIRVIRVIRG